MRWTRKGIIDEIKRLHAAGEELNYSSVEENHLNLVRAAAWHFGTWKRAVEKSGLDYESVSKYQRWTRERVVERIQELYKQGKDLSWRAVSISVDPPLAAAALRPNSGFESWFDAITAAGINHDEIARYRKWTSERVVQELRERSTQGLPMSSIAVQKQNPSLYCAAKRRFTQWDSALEQAGLDPNKIRIRRAPTSNSPRIRGAAAAVAAVVAEAKRPGRKPAAKAISTPIVEPAPVTKGRAAKAAPKPAKAATKAPVAKVPAAKVATAKPVKPEPAAIKPAKKARAAAKPAPAPEPEPAKSKTKGKKKDK